MIHANKMDEEGWYVTANVLSSCALALNVDEDALISAERLEMVLRNLVKECVNPADGGAFEFGEWPALDEAKKAIYEIDEYSEPCENADSDECECGEDTCVCLNPTALE